MKKAYYEVATGTIIKILELARHTSMDEDMRNHPELSDYDKQELSYITMSDQSVNEELHKMRVNPYTRKVELTYNALKDIPAPLPFKLWAGSTVTTAAGTASIAIPSGMFQKIDQVIATAEANVTKAEEVPHVAVKSHTLTGVQVNVTRYKVISGVLGLLPTGEFVGAGIKVNVLVLGK